MKVTKQKQVFEPVTITFETQGELDLITVLLGNTRLGDAKDRFDVDASVLYEQLSKYSKCQYNPDEIITFNGDKK